MNCEIPVIISIICAGLLYKRKLNNSKLKTKKRKSRMLWSRSWLLKRGLDKDLSNLVLNEFRNEDIHSFKNFTRMSVGTFQKLLQKVRPNIMKQNTVLRESISAETRLLVTLRFLASGETFVNLSYGFRISVPALCQIIPETLKAICLALEDEYMKMPQSPEKWREIAAEFEKKWNFPLCLGALDGKHIAFRAKKKDGSFYFNYKGFHSIILLALVDANYNFLYVNVGCNGRANDAAVFNESSLCAGIRNNFFNFPPNECLPGMTEKLPYIIVADDAFRLTERILKPHGQRGSDESKIFNYRLSRARRVVENAFGIMANKFRILQTDINLNVEKVELITITACILHNYIQKEEGHSYMQGADREDVQSLTFTPGQWRNTVFLTHLDKPRGNRSSDAGMDIRNRFTYYFNNIGFVPWQWEAIKKFNF